MISDYSSQGIDEDISFSGKSQPIWYGLRKVVALIVRCSTRLLRSPALSTVLGPALDITAFEHS